jgi:hypothetical protein
LPQLDGHSLIEVELSAQQNRSPHVTHIDPGAVVENAECLAGRLHLTLSGDCVASASIAGSSQLFMPGTTRVFSGQTEQLLVDAAATVETFQAELALIPSSGWVEATVSCWDSPGEVHRIWQERASECDVSVTHDMGALDPGSWCAILVNGQRIGNYRADSSGRISFAWTPGCPLATFEATGDTTLTAAGGEDRPVVPVSLANRPNPFSSHTSIAFRLPRSGRVRLRIYAIDGRLVRDLLDQAETEGPHTVLWDGLDQSRNPVSSGVYFCRLELPGRVESRRIAMIR